MTFCQISNELSVALLILVTLSFVLGFLFGYDLHYHQKLWKWWEEILEKRRKNK